MCPSHRARAGQMGEGRRSGRGRAGRNGHVLGGRRRRSACTGPERSGTVDPGQICTSQSPQCPATSSPGATAGRAHHPTRHPVGCSGHEPFWHRLCLGHQAAPARSRRAWHGHPCPSIEQLNGCRGRSVTGRRSHARRVGASPGSASDRVAAAGGRPGQRAARCASLVVPVTERPTRTDPDRPCPTETAGRPSLFQSWLGVRGQRCGPSPAPRVSRKDPLRGDRQREPAKRALTGAGRIDSNGNALVSPAGSTWMLTYAPVPGASKSLLLDARPPPAGLPVPGSWSWLFTRFKRSPKLARSGRAPSHRPLVGRWLSPGASGA